MTDNRDLLKGPAQDFCSLAELRGREEYRTSDLIQGLRPLSLTLA